MGTFRPWVGAGDCTGRVTPGAAALLAWLIANDVPPGRSGGIYNCRNIAGSKATSLHGEGRAVDWMLPVDPETRKGTAHGRSLVGRLAEHAWALGLQAIVYDRTIWSARSPQGRPFTGVHPHYDHLHIELAWEAANSLNLATIVSILGGASEKPAPTAPPQAPVTPPATPAPQPRQEDDPMTRLRTVNLSGATRASSTWVRSGAVATIQGLLVARGFAPANTIRNNRVDGIGGPGTRAAVLAFQRSRNIKADAIVGPITWGNLLDV